MSVTPEDVERVTRALGTTPVAWQVADPDHWNKSHRRYLVELPIGARVFVKIATSSDGADWLRDELRIYANVRGPFLPAFRGWDDDGQAPVLALEDLSGETSPPPWGEKDLAAVLLSLSEVAAAAPPPGTPLASRLAHELRPCWQQLGENPTELFKLGICSKKWFDKAILELWTAAQSAPIAGDALLHMDVRSDNLFIRAGWAVLFDWNWACIGNPILDLAAWLPHLHAEGGPAPEKLMPDDFGFASLLAGYFAFHASQPAPPIFPGVRELQFKQLRTALPWAARALGLPPPG